MSEEFQATQERLIEALLSHKDSPLSPIGARLLATGLFNGLQDWVDAEQERGTDTIEIMHVVTLIFGAAFGMLIVGAFRPGGYDIARKVFIETIDGTIGKIFTEARERRSK